MRNRGYWPSIVLLLLLGATAGPLRAQLDPPGNQYAVVIGVSRYKNLPDKQWLQFANEDARLFADFLKSNRVGLLPENIRLLLDEEATTTNIKSAIGSWLLDRASANDTVYIFFAGHGYVDRRNDGYLISYDANPDELYATAYSMRDLARIVNDRLEVRHLVLFTDACKSGYLGAEGLGQSRALEHNRINDALKEIVAENVAVNASRFILNAAGSFELSFEGEQWGGGHGVFTYNLVEGLRGAADRNADSRVTANEILDYVRDKVRLETADRQNPIVGSTLYSGDLVLSTSGGSGPAPAMVAPVAAADSFRPVPALAPVERQPVSAGRPPTGAVIVQSPMIEVELEIDHALRGVLKPGEEKVFVLAQGSHEVLASANGFVRDVREISVRANEQIPVSLEMLPIAGNESSGFNLAFAEGELAEVRESAEKDPAKAAERMVPVVEALLQTQERRLLTVAEKQVRDAALIQYIAAAGRLKSTVAAERRLRGFLQQKLVLFTPPEWEDPEQAPPLVARAMGQVRVSTDVAGAWLIVDGEHLGNQETERALLLAPGEHKIRLEKAGYVSRQETVVLEAGQREDRTLPLALGQVQVVVLSNTANAQALVGNELQGETESPAGVELRLTTSQRGVLRRLLERVPVTDQTPQLSVISVAADRAGPVPVRLSKPEFLPREIAINLTDQLLEEAHRNDGFLLYNRGELVTLDPEAGELTVQSAFPGASVYLDGRKVGETPFHASVGVGRYQVLVRHEVGKYATAVEIKPNEDMSLQADLRPSLAFLGIHSPEVTEDKYSGIVCQLSDRLHSTLTSYLVETPNPNQYEYWKDFVTLASRSPNSEEDKGKLLAHLQKMKERYAADLILYGYFPTLKDYLAGNIQLYLFSPPNPKPDLRVAEYNAEASLSSYAQALDARSIGDAALFRGWIGLRTVDTEVDGHELIVVQALPFGPAETSDLKPGDRIVSVDGQAANSLKLHQLVQSKAVGESIALETIDKDGSRKTTTLKIERIPAYLPLENQEFLLNSVIAKMRSILLRSPADSLEHSLALLNIALSHMQYENWEQALEFLTQIRLPEVNAVLVPAGVVEYLKGRCFESLGDAELAIQSYHRAIELKGSLMGTEYSEEVRELANWRLDTLQ